LLNCEAGLELQQAVFNGSTIRGQTEVLNVARLGYVTHLIICLTLTWPSSFSCRYELLATYVAEVKVRQHRPSEEEGLGLSGQAE
jgi:hypothetical protein